MSSCCFPATRYEVVNDLYAFLAPCFLRRVTPSLRALSLDFEDGDAVVLEAILSRSASSQELAVLDESAAEARATLGERLELRVRREDAPFDPGWMRAWPLWSELVEEP